MKNVHMRRLFLYAKAKKMTDFSIQLKGSNSLIPSVPNHIVMVVSLDTWHIHRSTSNAHTLCLLSLAWCINNLGAVVASCGAGLHSEAPPPEIGYCLTATACIVIITGEHTRDTQTIHLSTSNAHTVCLLHVSLSWFINNLGVVVAPGGQGYSLKPPPQKKIGYCLTATACTVIIAGEHTNTYNTQTMHVHTPIPAWRDTHKPCIQYTYTTY